MDLGAFSTSLAVKDIKASRDFYEKLGFEVTCDESDQGWMMLRNGDCHIGLFRGMFEKNILTFNPGMSVGMDRVDEFTDVRDIQRTLKKRGIVLSNEADETTTGAASVVLEDPDGNPILIDQFF